MTELKHIRQQLKENIKDLNAVGHGTIVHNFGNENEGVIFTLRDANRHIDVHITISLESLSRLKVITNMAVLGFIDTHLVIVKEKEGLAHILSTDEMLNYLRVISLPAPKIIGDASLVYSQMATMFSERNDEWSLNTVYTPYNREKLSLRLDMLYFLPLKELLDELVFIRIESYMN